MTNFAEVCNVREEKNMTKIAENMKSEMFMTKIQEVLYEYLVSITVTRLKMCLLPFSIKDPCLIFSFIELL
jgi:hypothetical protein